MGPGVPPPLSSPTHLFQRCIALYLSRLCHHNELNINDIILRFARWMVRFRPSLLLHHARGRRCVSTTAQSSVSHAKPSTISTGWLQTLLPFHLPPIKLVVSQRSYGLLDLGYLILRQVSHLDAFSGYLFRRSLLGYAVGTTTDTRALRPPRSSRTRGSSSQIPIAHSG